MTRPLSEFALNNTNNTSTSSVGEGQGSSLDHQEQNTSSPTLLTNNPTTSLQNTSLKDQEHMRLITENIQDLVCMHGPSGQLLYVASSCQTLLDYSNDELINQNPEQFIHPNDLSKVHNAFKAFIDNKKNNPAQQALDTKSTFQFRAIHKNGKFIWLDCQLQGIFDNSGNLVAAISTSKDISKTHLTEKQLRYHATHDLLTGLNNRRLFKERLSQALESVSSAVDNFAEKIAILHIDIDRFKIINENLGHQAGDKLLQAIAQRIRNEVKLDDIVARLGGDEFAILLFDIADSNDAIRIAERIQEKLQEAFKLKGQDIFITASIGVVYSDIEANNANQGQNSQDTKQNHDSSELTIYTSVDKMMGDAEVSMYCSKSGGKAQYTVFDKSIHADSNAGRRFQLESDLRTALKNDELFPLYHPILTLPSNKLTGFEVLLRWQHPEHGLISPVEFIPIAEETGLITEITLWLLEKACHELVVWQETTGFDLNLSINLSPRMFSIPDIDIALSSIIAKFPLNPSCINLEITEGLLMEDMSYGAELLNRLRSRGIRTHIDDFGTGYCSLSYLHTLPIDALKIDKSFISGKGELHPGIVQTIISLAHNLKIPAIAEGIEDTEQLSILNDLKCDQAQGFLFSKPISVDDVCSFLERHTSSGYIVGFETLEKIEMPRQNINGT